VFVLFVISKNLDAEPRILAGHQKGIKELVFSNEFRYLISCSYEFDIVVWNPYVEQPITKLLGNFESNYSKSQAMKLLYLESVCPLKPDILSLVI
jgi:hypothetical protein